VKESTTENNNYQEPIRAAIRYVLLILTAIYLISGLGITQWQIIERLTLGLLTRNLASRIHDFLLVPFVVLLLVHVLFRPAIRVYSHFKKAQRQQDP
jgi:thiosulfate reductase cytochrome b subunit